MRTPFYLVSRPRSRQPAGFTNPFFIHALAWEKAVWCGGGGSEQILKKVRERRADEGFFTGIYEINTSKKAKRNLQQIPLFTHRCSSIFKICSCVGKLLFGCCLCITTIRRLLAEELGLPLRIFAIHWQKCWV